MRFAPPSGPGLRSEIQLPGHAEAIVHPTEPLTEAVVAQGHQNLATFGQDAEYTLQLDLRIEFHEGRVRRREGYINEWSSRRRAFMSSTP